MNQLTKKIAIENGEAIERLKVKQAKDILESPESILRIIIERNLYEAGIFTSDQIDVIRLAITQSIIEYKEKREWAMEVENNEFITKNFA